MRSLKALRHVHGGKFTIQSGIGPKEKRDYWLIWHSLQSHPVGAVTRSAEIHRSWAMRYHMQERPEWRRSLRVYSLVYVLRGGGVFLGPKGPERPIREGDLLCLFPGVGHVYAPHPGTSWDEINVEFSGPVFDAWTGADLLDPAQPIRHLEPIPYWRRRFHQVVLPLARKRRETTLEDAARLVGLIAEMCGTWKSPARPAGLLWAERARKQLLSLPLDHDLDLVRVARSQGLTEQAYRKKFKRLCGVTPTLFRSRHLVEQACHLLCATDKPIKEIAYALGFGNEFYFMRRFKQITGWPPGEYRRLHPQ